MELNYQSQGLQKRAVTLPGGNLLVTPRTGHFDWVGSRGSSERAAGLAVALSLLLAWATNANLGRGLPCRYEIESYRYRG